MFAFYCVLIILVGNAINYVEGTNYYFSDSMGDDSSSRCLNMSAPCKTMSRLNLLTTQVAFKPGDNILFKRGDTFRGQIRDLSWWTGNETSPITFGAYGDASMPRPVLGGTYLLDGWTKNSNGLWVSKVPANFTDVQNVFVDGVKMPWGRTPNLDQPSASRYLTITASGNNFVATTDDKSPSGTWNGATLRIRIYLWSVTTRIVQSHTFDGTTATFTLSQPFEQGYVPSAGWKFYIENKMQAVDRPGEWSFDSSSSLLALYPLSSDFNPASRKIDIAVYTNAFVYVISKYMTFADITFWGQTQSAVLYQQSGATSTNIVFENCQFIDQEQSALEIHQISGLVIRNCVFSGQQNAALRIQADNAVIVSNTITNIGMVQGHQNKGGGVGIDLGGQNGRVSYNTIVNMSYNGIVFTASKNASITNNFVSGVTLTMSDGGAIYTYGDQSVGSLVQSNIVMNSRSLPWDGFSYFGTDTLSHGIYIDNYCQDITIDSNTVVDVDGSCLFANSGGHKWTNNLLVGAGQEGSIVVEEMAGNTVVNNYYANNIVYVRHPEDVGMLKETSNVNQKTNKMATYANNLYCNPYASTFFTWNNAGYEGGKGWEAWQAEGRDAGSKLCPDKFNGFYDAGNVTKAVVLNSNPTFDTNTNGWICSSCDMTWMASSPVSPNSGSLKVSVNSAAYTQLQTHGMTCSKGQYYRLRFRAYSTKEVVMWTGAMEDVPPYSIVPKQNLVFVITNKVHEYDEVFMSVVDSSCMVMLGSSYGPDTTLYFDDFYMEAVTMNPTIMWDHVAINPSPAAAVVTIPAQITWSDVYGNGPITCSVNLGPYQSKLLLYLGPNNPSSCTHDKVSAISKMQQQHNILIN